MIFKIVTGFLIVIAVLGMFGKLRLPYLGKGALRKPKKCTSCGRYLLSDDPCSCRKG